MEREEKKKREGEEEGKGRKNGGEQKLAVGESRPRRDDDVCGGGS